MANGLGFLENVIREIAARQEEDEARQEEDEARSEGISVEAVRARKEKEREARKQHAEKEELRRKEERQQRRKEESERRHAYGRSIGLGAPAHVGHVVNIGGLTERSAGNGMTRSTVWHVVIDGDMVSGRLRRRAGDLLCRKASSFGSRTMGLSQDKDWGLGMDGEWTPREVTCPKCLEILERIQKRKRNEAG